MSKSRTLSMMNKDHIDAMKKMEDTLLQHKTRIIKLQDNNLYYCYLKKLGDALVGNVFGSSMPNFIVIKPVELSNYASAYANGLVIN